MRIDQITLNQTYQIAISDDYNPIREFALLTNKRSTVVGTMYHCKILDRVDTPKDQQYPTRLILGSNKIIKPMNEEEWQAYKEKKINRRVGEILSPKLQWVGATINSFREYMK